MLHGEELMSRILTDVINLDDVGVDQPGGRGGLGAKPAHQIGVPGEICGEYFDRDLFSKGAVVGPAGPREQRRDRPPPTEEVAMLFVGAGREAGIRPGDLVGAITGEAGINSRELGAIEIADRFSLIDVPESRAEEIVAALRATTLRGKKVVVRRDRGPSANKQV
jgi:hypothetical protein